MKKSIYFVISLMLTVLAVISIPQLTAKADSVNITAVQPNGSTSMADAYLVKPATVNVVNNMYEVTYTIRTNKDLGTYPVKVLSMNVQTAGINNREDDGAYYTSITFKSNQLDNVTGTMKVDVDSANIHQTHPFGLKFSNPPKLNAGTSNQDAQNSTEAKPNTDTKQPDATADVNQSDPVKQDDAAKDKTQDKKDKKKSNKKAPKKNKQAKKSAKKADKSDKKTSNVPKISAGITLIAIAIGGGLFVKKRFF